MKRVLLVTILILIEFTNIGLSYYDGDDAVAVDADYDNGHVLLVGQDYFRVTPDDYYDDQKQNRKQQKKKDPNIVVLDSTETRNYKAELKAGNRADILGTNAHYYQPNTYPDFSRRFVLQYPYTEVNPKTKDETEKDKLIPKLASPEFVLAVAKESKILDAAKPQNPSDEVIRKDILRTGDYWNGVWREDVDPKVLRSKKSKKLELVKTQVVPESKLYDLVAKLKPMSPTLLYVINERSK